MSTIEELTPPEVTAFRVLEQRLSMPAASSVRAALENWLANEFRAIGSSGIVSDGKALLDALFAGGRPRQFEDFKAIRVAEGVVHITYISRSWWEPGWQPPVRRSSVWIYRHNRWQLLFRQGTRLPPEVQIVDQKFGLASR
jgi:hypothetical protein